VSHAEGEDAVAGMSCRASSGHALEAGENRQRIQDELDLPAACFCYGLYVGVSRHLWGPYLAAEATDLEARSCDRRQDSDGRAPEMTVSSASEGKPGRNAELFRDRSG
jgi:hypothetical protein